MNPHMPLSNRVRSDQQATPHLQFAIPHTLEKNHGLDAIRVRRICRFKNTVHDAVLSVCEVQELDHQSRTTDTAEEFRAGPSAPSGPGEFNESWYEVDITCPDIDEALENNELLSVGEEAAWNSEEIGKLVDNIVRPACQMLRRMDGVGFYNDNGHRSERVAPAPNPEPPEVFW